MKAVIDIILLIIIALCTWNGYKRGLVGGIAGILAIVVALFGSSLLSSAYSHEVVPALEPFIDGYVDSQANRDAVLESMGYGDSDYSVEDIIAQDSSLKYDYAYECLLSVGFYSKTSEKLAAREAEYKARFANPFVAGARGFIDDVIQPHETRKRICRSLTMLQNKQLDNPWRKHGNIPL